MKKILCMVLALVLMMGAMVLPASAEGAQGKIYKLPAEYSNYIGMGGGVIVVGKTVYDSALEMELTKYGAIDYTGKTIVPFEYDIASAPNDEGEFFVSTIDYDKLTESYLSVSPYFANKNGELMDLDAHFDTGEDIQILPVYYSDGALTVMYAFEYLESASMIGVAYATYELETLERICQFGAVDMTSNVCTDGEYWAFTGDSTLWIKSTDRNVSEEKVEIEKISENDYITPVFLDNGLLYYVKLDSTSETTEIFRYNIETGAKESLTELYGCVDVYTSMISDCVVADSGKYVMGNADGKYAFVDELNDVNTGFIFDYVYPDFSDGYFCAMIGEEYTYYTTDGKPTDKVFVDNIKFSKGTSFVTDASGDTYAVDTDLNRVSENALALDSETILFDYKDGVLVAWGENFEIYTYTADQSFSIYGDVTGDGKVDVADIMKMKNYIMADESAVAADLNADGKVDVADIMQLKTVIMAS